MLPLLLSLPSLALGGQFVDICRADSGHQCCAPSMAGSEYWVMRTPGSWTELEVECRWSREYTEADPHSYCSRFNINYRVNPSGLPQLRFYI